MRTLISRPTPAVVTGLAERGIEYVVLRAPADGQISATLDAASGLDQASAEDRRTRAWRVDRALPPGAVAGPASALRTALLVVQVLALLVVCVLCVPSRRVAR
ncbi:MAG: hypothetical protein R2734_21010 [Nocardioides sp.]